MSKGVRDKDGKVEYEEEPQAGAATGCCHETQINYTILNSSFNDGKIVSGNSFSSLL